MNVDYNNCLVNLSNSILKYFDCETHNNSLEYLDEILKKNNSKNVVLILCDGMGSIISEANLNKNDFLIKNRINTISSVYPPTTTAATTSLDSGLYPCEHGWLGWDLYVKPIDKIVTMFLNTLKDSNKQAKDYSVTDKYFKYKSIIESINEKHKAYSFATFKHALPNPFQFILDKALELCNKDEKKYIYLYNDQPDALCHELGYEDERVVNLYRRINDQIRNFCNSVVDTTVIVVADHGHITCEPIPLSEYKDIFSTLKMDTSIEGRTCNFFIKENKKEEFVKLFNKYFKEDFILLTKEEILEKNIFGYGTYHPLFKDSLGDFLAIATSNKYFRYNENSVLLKSMHAGPLDIETKVPLIVYKG